MGRNYPVLRGVGLNKTIKVNLITLPKFQGKGGGDRTGFSQKPMLSFF